MWSYHFFRPWFQSEHVFHVFKFLEKILNGRYDVAHFLWQHLQWTRFCRTLPAKRYCKRLFGGLPEMAPISPISWEHQWFVWAGLRTTTYKQFKAPINQQFAIKNGPSTEMIYRLSLSPNKLWFSVANCSPEGKGHVLDYQSAYRDV